MTEIGSIATSDLDEREDLAQLAEEASAFLLAHENWCKGIRAGYVDRGFSKVAAFLYEVEILAGGNERIWVVVGDLPRAHIDYELCPNGAAALDGYVAEMLAWAEAVRLGNSTEELIPVVRRGSLAPVEPTMQVANMLKSRMDFVRREILPFWADELDSGLLNKKR